MAEIKQYRRVNIFAGPGAGKTSLTAYLFSQFKKIVVENDLQLQIEQVSEYVKQWAWEGRKPVSLDQWFIFANQHRLEEVPLRSGVDIIFTDSPIMLNAFYAQKNNIPGANSLLELAKTFESFYPSINIFLDRKDRTYISKGRYETEDQAKSMDDYIRKSLDIIVGSDNYKIIEYNKYNDIMRYIISQLNMPALTNAYSLEFGERKSPDKYGADARSKADSLDFGGSDFCG